VSAKSQELLQQYFRGKRRQLLAMSEQAVVEHSGLRGSYREELQRIYLREILPGRFSVGQGMVYGLVQRSKEADIVIWDAANYPSLPLVNHALYFAESVRVVLESKSVWSREQFLDVLDKCRSVRTIVPFRAPTMEDEIALINLRLAALEDGIGQEGMLISKPHIGTAAIFIRGGQAAMTNLDEIDEDIFNEADNSWPDLVLWLEPGRIAFKQYPENEGIAYVEIVDYGEDGLLVFTSSLLKLLTDRSVTTEDHFDLDRYMILVKGKKISSRPFPMGLWPPGRTPLWRTQTLFTSAFQSKVIV
jgi:hypothetical protein